MGSRQTSECQTWEELAGTDPNSPIAAAGAMGIGRDLAMSHFEQLCCSNAAETE